MNLRRKRSSQGFTLVELLVVMSIMALVLGAAVVARPKIAAVRLQAETKILLAELGHARSQAIKTNTETVFRIDTEQHLVTVGKSVHRLPKNLSVAMVIADRERSEAIGGLRFFPDGQSSGGDIVLALDGRRSEIAVNWLTGQPQVRQ